MAKDSGPTYSDEWPVKQFKRKSTKKWCRGKVGREHIPVVELDKNFESLSMHTNSEPCVLPENNNLGKFTDGFSNFFYCSHHVVCSTCGKELAMRPDVCPTTGLVLGG